MIEDKIFNIKEFIERLNYYTQKYDEGKPKITDEQWDNMYFELKKLEEETGIIYPNSPTQKINYEVVSELSKVTHQYKPMLSLDKTKDPDFVQSFVSGHEWCAMFKLDGLSCRLTYKDGNLVRAETRGNGVEGELITHNAFVINNIPKKIPTTDIEVIIDGEMLCDIETFNEYFSKDYENPRNFAAGAIRLLSSNECSKRHLSFIAWDLIKGCEDIDFFFHRLEILDDWGFDTVPRIGDAETVEDAISYLDGLKKDSFYPIDGYVFRFESQKYYNQLGRTSHHFKGAIAYKFYDQDYETELYRIDFDVSRNGILTPVAVFKPINIDGTECSKASLHNLSIMRDLLGEYPDLYQSIWVCKKNQIIPQITKAVKNDIPHDHIIFDINKVYCPICGNLIKVVTSDSGVQNMICDNDKCEGKLANIIDHYCGKKGLDIKGLSKKTIEKLINWGWLNNLKNLYELKNYESAWIQKPGFGKTSVGKILKAIDAEGRHPKLDSFISALGIPLVGQRVAKEIVKYYDTWDDFRAAVGGDWTQFEGFGPEISSSINKFDFTEADKIAKMIEFKEEVPPAGSAIKKLIKELDNLEQSTENFNPKFLEGKTFVVTGKLYRFKNRNELKDIIEQYGGRVTGSISSKTDYLINNDNTSTTSKNKKAKELGIPIINEEEFLYKRF